MKQNGIRGERSTQEVLQSIVFVGSLVRWSVNIHLTASKRPEGGQWVGERAGDQHRCGVAGA